MPASSTVKSPPLKSSDDIENGGDTPEIFLTPLAKKRDPFLKSEGPKVQESIISTRKNPHSSIIGSTQSRQLLSLTFGKTSSRPRLGDRASTADSIRTLRSPGIPPDEHQFENIRNGRYHTAQTHSKHLLRRSSSNSQIETKCRRPDLALHNLNSAELKQRLKDETAHTGKGSVSPWRTRQVRNASSPIELNLQVTPSFRWFAVRANSDPSSPRLAPITRRGKDFPLKPCMKQKSKSAATTPTNRNPTANDDLRRVKVVDFKGSVSDKLLSLPLSPEWMYRTRLGHLNMGKVSTARQYSGENAILYASNPRRKPSFPGPAAKSKPADTAITRTDVHVVAIAPSWSADEAFVARAMEQATPTMQIVESQTGCYEVIWDNVPPEDDTRTQRRRSSASLSLRTANSAGARGLERVNTKLTEWSWGGDGSETSFRPRIVVFPDYDDDYVAQFGFTGEEDEALLVPPSSERTSADASRQPSHQPSIRPSRDPSRAETESEPEHEDDQSRNKAEVQDGALVIPDPTRAGQLASRIGLSRAVRKPLSNRRLSNMEDADLRFRDHRDSVTIARSRIFNAGGVSPELFMHRDSIAMAKKRMHLTHAISSPRQIYHSRIMFSDPLPPINDIDRTPPSTPRIEGASRRLRESTSASVLLPGQSGLNRHIRIIE